MLDAVLLRVIAPGQTSSSDYIKLKRALISLNNEIDDKKVLGSEGSSLRLKFKFIRKHNGFKELTPQLSTPFLNNTSSQILAGSSTPHLGLHFSVVVPMKRRR